MGAAEPDSQRSSALGRVSVNPIDREKRLNNSKRGKANETMDVGCGVVFDWHRGIGSVRLFGSVHELKRERLSRGNLWESFSFWVGSEIAKNKNYT